MSAEVRTADHLDLPRLALRFDRVSLGRLRALIDAINQLPTAPATGELDLRVDADAMELAGSPVQVEDDDDDES